uniref:Exosome complex component CSL4 C-terminal domain-containing protein n=1 Tax=Quercus lobata TaxID=97700 RepID=A0A7N2KQJ5_QUELO
MGWIDLSTWAGGSIFSEEEVSLAIKNMNGDKAPGSYGFDIAFLPKMLRSGQSRGEVAIGLSCKRQQDVRATEIDKVDMHLSFRPGDIIRAVVLSLGDARAYYLSTAKNELGVVSAESTAGETMVPISWTEMQCPLTGQIEQRKVAKIGG